MTSMTGSGGGAAFLTGRARRGSAASRGAGSAELLFGGAAADCGVLLFSFSGGGAVMAGAAGTGSTEFAGIGSADPTGSASTTTGGTGFSEESADGFAWAGISLRTLTTSTTGLFSLMDFLRNTMPPTAVIMPKTASVIAQRPPPTAINKELVDDRIIDEDEALGDLRLALD